MAQIHVLDQETINKIAAGEVIERPMAVVKELVENAIDAKANAITVEIKDGGKSLIRITDNGSGIAKEDIPLAFTPHATSKIHDVEDLLEVSSLGFRGEALASIAAVSQLEMVTKTRQAFMGSRYVIHGGEEKEFDAVGCPDGTTFLVHNLFYNTPARLKFLKTPPTEAGYISTTIERLALSHPEVAFRFIAQNQTKISTPGNGNLKDVIYHIYGREIAANLLELHTKEVFCQVDGFLGKPVISRGNRNYMIYFINGRFIRSNVIHRAIEEAYAPYSMQHRYPFTALHITIDPTLIDVNVHPQKMEIRFTKEKEIFQSVYHAVSEGLKKREYIPEVLLQSGHQEAKSKQRGAEFFETKRRLQSEKDESGVQQAKPQQSATGKETRVQITEQKNSVDSSSENTSTPTNVNRSADTIEKSQPQTTSDREAETGVLQANTIYTAATDEDKQAMLYEQAPDYRTAQPMQPSKQSQVIPEKVQQETPDPEAHKETQKPVKAVQESLFEEEGALTAQKQKEIRIVGQLFSTYWILQYEDAMYMIDQHAAHEKVMYERFMKQLKEKKPLIQMIQPPIVISLSMEEEQALQAHDELLTQLGFEIEPFGGREYAVVGVPAHLPPVETNDLLMEALAMLGEHHAGKAPQVLLEKVASMSCKAAVKGNNELDARQAEELIRELMTLENPYHCPHGRPTMIRMSKREIEKKFKRIV